MRSNTGMSIKVLLSAVIGVLSLMLIGESTGPLLRAFERVSVAERVAVFSVTGGYLLEAVRNFRNERSTLVSALLADHVGGRLAKSLV